MNQAILAGQHFHKRSKGGRGNNLTGVQFPDFNGLEHARDQFQSTVQAFLVGGVNMHGAIFLDIDIGAGFGLASFMTFRTSVRPAFAT